MFSVRRHELVRQVLPADLKDIPIHLGEFGLDKAGGSDNGWRGPSWNWTVEQYAAWLVQICGAIGKGVDTAAMFGCGMRPDWWSFETLDQPKIADAIRLVNMEGGQTMPVIPRPEAIACARVALREWTQDEAVIAVAIAGAESAWIVIAKGDKASDLGGGLYDLYACEGYTSFGLWQINTRWHYPELQRYSGSSIPCDWRLWLGDPANNARLAHDLYVGRGGAWVDWSAYNGGQYKAYLAEAEAAVDAVLAEPSAPPSSEPVPPLPATVIQRIEILERRMGDAEAGIAALWQRMSAAAKALGGQG